jgi:hypothetical protein
MKSQPQLEREIAEIVLAASAGEATESQLARLSELILSDDSLAQFTVDLWNQEAWLTSQGAQSHTDELLAELALLRTDGPALKPAELPRLNPVAHAASTSIHLPHWLLATMTVAALVGTGVLTGGLVTWWAVHSTPSPIAAVGESAASAAPQPSPFVGRFVQGTACVWGPDTVPPRLDDNQLRRGESLNLMEGLAEIELELANGGHAALQIEGPARMMLTAEGVPSLNLGKFSAKVYPGLGEFTLDTPFGQVIVLRESSVGIAVHGLDVEVHVFNGQVAVKTPWSPDGNAMDQFTVESGQSLTLSIAGSSAMQAMPGTAEPGRFASLTSMASDRLEISADYVRAVKEATPLVYWRFEEPGVGRIKNEMSDRFAGVIVGSPDWVQHHENHAIEFGTGLTNETLQAYVESSEPFQREIDGSYTIEVWVKPSHYHLGTLASLARNLDAGSEHGALLELGGPLTTPSTIEHPGRVRFLHRDPPSADALAGTSCFSQGPYELRRWEHLVAVKDGGEMRLYVNGEMVGKADDNTGLAENFSLLIGQLDRHRDWRRFVGQLDELAVYGRALSEGEIRQHYQLVRPKKAGDSI